MALYSNGSIGLRMLLGHLRLTVWSFIVTGVVQGESGRGVIDTTQYRFSYVCLEIQEKSTSLMSMLITFLQDGMCITLGFKACRLAPKLF